MNIIFTVLFALPIGYFLKNRGIAIVTYLALDAIVFSYQSIGVLLDWMADNPPVAFGPFADVVPRRIQQQRALGVRPGQLGDHRGRCRPGSTRHPAQRPARRAANSGHRRLSHITTRPPPAPAR